MSADPWFQTGRGELLLTQTSTATSILMSGCLCIEAVDRLDQMLSSLPEDESTPVLLRITSTELEFGATNALGQLLSPRRRLASRPLAVWADEPIVRHAIPISRLHATPPVPSHDWDTEVPVPH